MYEMFTVVESFRERLTRTWKCGAAGCQVLERVLQRSEGCAEEFLYTL